MATVTELTPRCVSLISEIKATLGLGLIAEPDNKIAEGVRRIVEKYLTYEDLLTPKNCQSDPETYCQNLLYVEPDGSFSVVALVWLPGQFTPIHDHISWCVVGTYQGEEEETRYELSTRDGKEYLIPLTVNVNPRGQAVFVVPPGDIHKVRNSAEEMTISIHVYGADISVSQTSIRRRYEHPVLSA